MAEGSSSEREENSSDSIQHWIDRLAAGDETACAELIRHATSRLEILTHRMCRDYPGLGRWEESDDIRQNASLRLWKALHSTRPTSAAGFYSLAALQIRRELIDQVRHYFGPEGVGLNHASNALDDPNASRIAPRYEATDTTYDPGRLARWAEFHQKVAELPEDDRVVFDLLWYQGLTQPEAAELLGISERTLKRRWLASRLALGTLLEDAFSE